MTNNLEIALCAKAHKIPTRIAKELCIIAEAAGLRYKDYRIIRTVDHKYKSHGKDREARKAAIKLGCDDETFIYATRW